MSDDDWTTVMRVHLQGAFTATQLAQKHMVEAKYGRVISMSSTSATGNRGQANYSTAKMGLQGFTKTMAIELGPFGITANAIAPGFIETAMTKATAERVGTTIEAMREGVAARLPVRRGGVPDDIANAAAFFAAEESGYVTGQVLYVDGGQRADLTPARARRPGPARRPRLPWRPVFDTLSDRLSAAFTSLRGKGRLTDADIDATAREIRIALLEADVALPVVKAFVAAVKERARGAEVSKALNPAQQVIKIVDEELVAILGGETRRLRFAKNPPTVILLAGLQGAGKTTLAGKLAHWLKEQGHTPLLVACDLQRPNAVTQLQVVGQRAGVPVYAPQPGNGVGDPVEVARRVDRVRPPGPARHGGRRHRGPPRHRHRDDAAGRGHP